MYTAKLDAMKLLLAGTQDNDQGHNAAVLISDVRVYSRALSESDVQALFQQGRRSALTPAPTPAPTPDPTPAPTPAPTQGATCDM